MTPQTLKPGRVAADTGIMSKTRLTGYAHHLTDGTVILTSGLNPSDARAGIWERLPSGVGIDRTERLWPGKWETGRPVERRKGGA